VVALLAGVEEAVAAVADLAAEVAAVAGGEVAVVALFAGIEVAVAAFLEEAAGRAAVAVLGVAVVARLVFVDVPVAAREAVGVEEAVGVGAVFGAVAVVVDAIATLSARLMQRARTAREGDEGCCYDRDDGGAHAVCVPRPAKRACSDVLTSRSAS